MNPNLINSQELLLAIWSQMNTKGKKGSLTSNPSKVFLFVRLFLCCYGCFCGVSTYLLVWLSTEQTEINIFKSSINFIFQSDYINIYLYYLYLVLSFLYLKVSYFYNRSLFWEKWRRGGKEESRDHWHFLVCILPCFFNLKISKYCCMSRFSFIFNTCPITLAACTIF